MHIILDISRMSRDRTHTPRGKPEWDITKILSEKTRMGIDETKEIIDEAVPKLQFLEQLP
jgi:hypothetical protein